ncbi:MAG: aminotransferase class I/II-fold pyridoxal phosphate-dependent enzyme [candidate division KSB1 bacterium]|nr:aminotransferase class I/II-fold pyridoxal phosphate-dependent enzyme [candidate division KSB1 bacterium]
MGRKVRQAKNEEILLDKNENKYGPSGKCMKVLRSLPKRCLCDYARDDNRSLRQLLAERFGVDADQVLLGYGAEDLLKQVFEVALKPGQPVLLPSHGWYYYDTLSQARQLERHTYMMYRKGRQFVYDYQSLLRQFATLRPRLTVVCSPNNPTGSTFDPDHFEALLMSARADQILLFDQAYAGFASGGQPPIGRWLHSYSNLMVLGTFSKYYALAGARIGFALVGKGLPEKLGLSERLLGFSQVLEQLGIAALQSEKYYRSVANKTRRDRERLIEKINSLPGFVAFESEANFFLAQYPPDARQLLAEELAKRRLKIKFITDEPAFANMVRISVGKQEHTALLLAALNAVGKRLAFQREMARSLEAMMLHRAVFYIRRAPAVPLSLFNRYMVHGLPAALVTSAVRKVLGRPVNQPGADAS